MREVMADIDNWLATGKGPVGLATVVTTWGSAPRREGGKLAFTGAGAISGSVSGGCVEGAVLESGQEALETSRPRLLTFGVADETAWEVGLACGGTIRVFVEPLDNALYAWLRQEIAAERRATVVTLIRGPEGELGRKIALDAAGRRVHLPGTVEPPDEVMQGAREASRPRRLELADGSEWFIDVIRPLPTLVLIGAVHMAVALVDLARVVGFRTVVIDPRRAFADPERFPHADRLLAAWPAESLETIGLTADSAVVTLSHDPKIDDPALQSALDSDCFYIGALGSRKTQAARRERLAARGYSPAALERIHGPVGLPIGAENPEEIALAILAEVVAEYRRRN